MATQQQDTPDNLIEVSRIIGALQEGQRQIEARLGSIEARLGSIEARLGSIDENQRETNRRIDRVLYAVIGIGIVVVGTLIANTIAA